jgi:hypothetical protein
MYLALILAFIIGIIWGWGVCSMLSVAKRTEECAECAARERRKGLRVVV